MKRFGLLVALCVTLVDAAPCAHRPDAPPIAFATSGFRPLFNGRDLSGWINVNGKPDTWQVRDGMLVTTGLPHGFLRTENVYENFILRARVAARRSRPVSRLITRLLQRSQILRPIHTER